jgi:hypothetical protein
MDDRTRNLVRLAGVLAVAAAVAWAVSDLLLLYAPGRPDDPVLARYGDAINRNASTLVAVSTDRLLWGSLLGVLTGPLYLLGYWHVYQGIKPAGRWLALPSFLLLAYGNAMAPFIHGSVVFVGETLRTLTAVDPADQDRLFALFEFQSHIVRGMSNVMMATGVIGSLGFAVAVGKGGTFYPRWMALFNPAVVLVVVMGSGHVLPSAVSAVVSPASLNIASFIFYSLSTALLWNAGREK